MWRHSRREEDAIDTVSALRAFPIFPKTHPLFLLVSILDVVRTSLLQDYLVYIYMAG
jgi:hypothetical protein